MDEFEINHQSVYFGQRNSNVMAVNLLYFGINQFLSTVRFRERNSIKEISEVISLKPNEPIVHPVIQELALNNLIDSIKITICFENFFKAIFLANGFVIHSLDKEKFPNLHKEQKKRPISLEEVKAIKEWEINEKIQTEKFGLKLQLDGLTSRTISLNILTSNKYIEKINFDKNFLKVLTTDFRYRNTLHLHHMEKLTLNSSSFLYLRDIIRFVNDHHIRIHNSLIDSEKMDSSKKLGQIPFES